MSQADLYLNLCRPITAYGAAAVGRSHNLKAFVPTRLTKEHQLLSGAGDKGIREQPSGRLSMPRSDLSATALQNNAGAVLGEHECIWAKVSDTRMSLSSTRDTEGYEISQITYRVGAQREFAPGWHVGGSLGGGPTWSSSDNGASG